MFGQMSVSIMSSRMETLNLDVEVDDFWFNFCSLKADCYSPLPSTSITYACSCGETLSLFENGEYYCEYSCSSHNELIEKEEKKMIEEHISIKGNDSCRIKIDENIGLPDNLIFMTKNFEGNKVSTIKIGEETYFPTVVILKSNWPILVLFNKNTMESSMLHKFITLNFPTLMNIPCPAALELEDMEDEDDVHENQQSLPRLEGGGRRFMQEYKYVCQWCTAEQLTKKTRGRFRELKNYRDHFR